MNYEDNDTNLTYNQLVRNYRKVLDTRANRLLTQIPFNWHITCHLKTPRERLKDALSPIIEFDWDLVSKALYRFTRGNVAIGFEDTSIAYRNHIHLLLLLPTLEREIAYFTNLRSHYVALGKIFPLFQGPKLIQTDINKEPYSHISPIRDSETALDYCARLNLPFNRLTYKHHSIPDIGRIPPMPDRSSIPFHKKNPCAELMGYSLLARSTETYRDLPYECPPITN